MIDFTSEFGQKALDKLKSEQIIWLTTVGSDGTPQPRPVWFLWENDSLLIYSQPQAYKVRHIERVPSVALNFNSDFDGNHVIVLTGEARLDPSTPPGDQHVDYLNKYRKGIQGLGSTEEQFAKEYSVPIRIYPKRLRGW
jgi:PPOX class probable F420-dependent enzyme